MDLLLPFAISAPGQTYRCGRCSSSKRASASTDCATEGSSRILSAAGRLVVNTAPHVPFDFKESSLRSNPATSPDWR